MDKLAIQSIDPKGFRLSQKIILEKALWNLEVIDFQSTNRGFKGRISSSIEIYLVSLDNKFPSKILLRIPFDRSLVRITRQEVAAKFCERPNVLCLSCGLQ